MPPEAANAVSRLLSAIQDPRGDLNDLPPGIIEHHDEVAGDLAETYQGTATIQELSTGGSVGIVTLVGDDLVLIADEGEGFDPTDVPDPLAEENILRQSGRGVLMIKAFMDSFEVRQREPHGTEVRMTKLLPKQES